jgi:hypothetical protein
MATILVLEIIVHFYSYLRYILSHTGGAVLSKPGLRLNQDKTLPHGFLMAFVTAARGW